MDSLWDYPQSLHAAPRPSVLRCCQNIQARPDTARGACVCYTSFLRLGEPIGEISQGTMSPTRDIYQQTKVMLKQARATHYLWNLANLWENDVWIPQNDASDV